MVVNLSIKNVPEDLVRRRKVGARQHRRSLEEELMAILLNALRPRGSLTPDEVLGAVRALSLSTPSDAVAMIRRDRDDPRELRR